MVIGAPQVFAQTRSKPKQTHRGASGTIWQRWKLASGDTKPFDKASMRKCESIESVEPPSSAPVLRGRLAARTGQALTRDPPPSTCRPQPHLIRLREAPNFFGMDKNRFNRELRPRLTEIRIGTQGVAFDRLEMEAAADDYKSRNGRPAAQSERSKSWDNVKGPDSHAEVGSGISTSKSEEFEFAKALERVISSKRKNNSRSG
jgi:hypothetical protein